MEIQKAKITDVEHIMPIYSSAKAYMNRTGNPTQWVDGYPSKEDILDDIENEHLYICKDSENETVAVFCFFIGDDPNYHKIEGAWLNDNSYGAVHRIASNGKISRIADYCLEWCFTQHQNIRIDTHQANRTMQKVLERCGYTKCGIIYLLRSGDSRVAFQKSK